MRRGLVIATLLAACTSTPENGEPASGLTTSAGSGDDSAGSTATDGDPTGPEKFDIASFDTPSGNSGGDGETDTCKKVDLLFVIDNSGSMADEQINLVNSFPGFIESMQTTLADTEGYHVGVTTTDLYAFNGPGCLVEGGLVTRTGGVGSSNAVCNPYASGLNYMSEADDLSTTFACAAQVGTGGDGNERPMQTMTNALSDGLNAPGMCNDGFIRDDALLVIVLITDEEDDSEVAGCLAAQTGSFGNPDSWYQEVVDIKGGVESNVVVLSLVGPDGQDVAACPALDKCAGGIDGAEEAPRILDFTRRFTHGFVGRVCEPSYDGFFQEAVSVIKSACDDFTPPG